MDISLYFAMFEMLVNDVNDPANDKENSAAVAIFLETSAHKNTFALFTGQRFGLFMHFCDSNHEITRMQKEENINTKNHKLISC